MNYGAISVFAGQYSSGKSTAAALAMAQYQRENPDKTCVYVDVENTLPIQLPHFVKMTGLQTSIQEIEKLMNDTDLKDLKEKTAGVEAEIKRYEKKE